MPISFLHRSVVHHKCSLDHLPKVNFLQLHGVDELWRHTRIKEEDAQGREKISGV